MNENKEAFVQELGELLAKYSREDIEGMNYDKDTDGECELVVKERLS